MCWKREVHIHLTCSTHHRSLVSIPFHQIMRCTLPVLTVVLYRLRYNRNYATKTYISLVPIVVGVALATYGDYYFTAAGFILTLFGVILALIKVSSAHAVHPICSLLFFPLFVMPPRLVYINRQH